MSKKIILLLISLLYYSNLHAKNDFVPGIADLPVPASFYLDSESSSIYNDNYGRLVTASFIGKAKQEEILDFYYKTLPALGWKKEEFLHFSREGEILTINIIAKNQEELIINFQLNPASD